MDIILIKILHTYPIKIILQNAKPKKPKKRQKKIEDVKKKIENVRLLQIAELLIGEICSGRIKKHV